MKKSLLILTTALAGTLCVSAAGVQEAARPSAPELLAKYELKNASASVRHNALGKPSEIRKANVDLYSGRILDAAMIYNSSWDNLGWSEVPYGLYQLDMGALTSTPVITDPYNYSFMSGAYTDTEFIGLRVMSMMGTFTGINIVSLDPQTKTENWSEMRTIEEGTGMNDVSSVIAYNPVSGKLYAINYNADLTGMTLNEYNKETHVFEPYADWQVMMQPLTMAFSPLGVCYVICTDGVLYTLDMQTGALSNVGNTGQNLAMYSQAMTFDGVTGNFIWAAITDRGSKLFALDPATAEAELIAGFENNEQFVALHLPSTAFYGAPAAVSQISWGGYGGSLEGNVNFTLPNTTFGGASYTGDLAYTLWIDGEAVAENVKSQGGQWISVPAELSNGSHLFAVSTVNKVGRSPLTTARYWVGPDYPSAPENVSLATEERNFRIEWWPVMTGKNDGYVDTYNLTYNIYRMPDNVCVAEGVSGNSYIDPIPAEMKRYYYEVAAVNTDGKIGDRQASNIMLEGQAASLPYYEDFSNDSFLSLYRLIDNDGNGINWTYADWNGELNCSTFQGTEDDWAITPPIRFEAGNRYQVTLNIRTAWDGYFETWRVMLGKENMELDEFTEIAKFEDQVILDFEDVTADFSVPESGDYELAIVGCSRGASCSTIRLSALGVDLIGKLTAPAEVTEMTVAPDADDALKATVSFRLPSTSLQDDAISSLSYAEIYVDDQPMAKVENVVPGQNISQIVENIPTVGKHKFTVAAANENGLGKKISKYSFIGCYSAPWTENFDSSDALEFWTSEFNFDASGLVPPLSYSTFKSALEMAVFSSAADQTTWVFTPDFKLDSETVYMFDFDFTNQYFGESPIYLTIGQGAESAAQTELMTLPTESRYNAVPVSAELVIADAGKYNLGFNLTSQKEYEYLSYQLDNVSLKYLTSAKAPYNVTNVTAVADKDGKLEADLTFKAPVADFAERELTNITRIEIYRGDNVIPVATFDNPAPGSELTWHDSNANYGVNNYMLVATNEYGRGKAYTSSLFVGEDVPAIENVKITSTPDNMTAVLSWDRCEFGVNGGVLLDDDLSYTLLKYNPGIEEFEVVATGVTDNSYTFETVTEPSQVYYYYAVVPVNDVKSGAATICSIVLGELHQLPFAESFAEGIPGTELWSIYSQNPFICWQPMNGFLDGYEAQDNDGGCIGFFNGNGYANYAGDRLFSPKLAMSNWTDPVLSFWVLHVRQSDTGYQYPSLLRVNISADDEEFVQISEDDNMEFDGSNPVWTKYEFDLSDYRNANNLRFALDGYTNGGYEVLYVDNIRVEANNWNSVEGLTTSGLDVKAGKGVIFINNAEGADVEIYNPSGLRVAAVSKCKDAAVQVSQGVYVVNVEGKSFKVYVK